MSERTQEQKANEAVELATDLIGQCMNKDMDTLTTFAAFGNAFYRLAFALRYPPETFDGMLEETKRLYRETWEIHRNKNGQADQQSEEGREEKGSKEGEKRPKYSYEDG